MATHEVNVVEGADAVDAPGEPVLKREERTYVVTAEAGLTKYGQHWPQGSEIPLEVETGARFVAAGDVEEAR